MKRIRCCHIDPCDECGVCEDDACLRCGLGYSSCTCELAVVPSAKSRNVRGPLQSFDIHFVGFSCLYLYSTLTPFGVGGYRSEGQLVPAVFYPLRGVSVDKRHSPAAFVDGVYLRGSLEMGNFAGATGNWFADCMVQILFDSEVDGDSTLGWNDVFVSENAGPAEIQFIRPERAARFTSVWRKRFAIGAVGSIEPVPSKSVGDDFLRSQGGVADATTLFPVYLTSSEIKYDVDIPLKKEVGFGVGYPNQVSIDEYVKLNGRRTEWTVDSGVTYTYPGRGNYFVAYSSNVYVPVGSGVPQWISLGVPELQLAMRWKYFSK